MILSPNEAHFLIWAAFTMVTVLGFIGALGVKALMSMGKDLNDVEQLTALKEALSKL